MDHATGLKNLRMHSYRKELAFCLLLRMSSQEGVYPLRKEFAPRGVIFFLYELPLRHGRLNK